jgi:hypothetical protein
MNNSQLRIEHFATECVDHGMKWKESVQVCRTRFLKREENGSLKIWGGETVHPKGIADLAAVVQVVLKNPPGCC